MAMQAVKVKNDDSQGNAITGVASGLGEKVTGSIAGTKEFLHDVRVEVKQVTWPSREDVISTTGVVIATVAFFGVFLAIVEKLAQLGLDRLLKYFHVYSGFEKKVKESLESRVAAFSLQDKIGRVLIPTEEVVEVRGGKKVVASRMSYPGYVLVEMDLDENTWHIVRNTPRVTGFVGSATAPPPLSESEVDAIINRVHTPQDRPKPKVVYERNEQVRIVDGPFANFNGTVEEIDNDHSRLKVSVTIFGRSTPVELDFASVEKLG
jgi:transcriptional antiterminator NusG